MRKLRSGTDVATWLVGKTSGFLDSRFSRRSFIARTTLVGTAVAASGCAVITQPGSPYTYISNCPGGALCRDGYTEFCCVINKGVNACPPDTFAAGWWRADYSVYCNGTRYYIDCNNWSGAGPCRCGDGCSTRKVYCNHFRYGQCNPAIPGTGVIACRMVVCTPPYQLNIGCSPSGAVDNSTANHIADCARYIPPPPLVSVPVLATVGSAVSAAPGQVTLVVRGADGAAWHRDFNGSAWSPAWQSLGGSVASKIAAISPASGTIELAMRGAGGTVMRQRFSGGVWPGWQSIGTSISSDISLGLVGTKVHLVVRGTDNSLHTRSYDGTTMSSWQSLGGTGTSDPVMMSNSTSMAFFVRGTDGTVSERIYNGSWLPWATLGGLATSDPGAAKTSAVGHMFVLGSGNQLYTKRDTGGGFPYGGWEALGTGASDPVAIAEGNEVSLFIRGSDHVLWHRRWNGSWQAWESLGLVALSNPATAVDGSGLWVFAQGSDNLVHYRRRSGGSWSAAASLTGLAVAPVRGTA